MKESAGGEEEDTLRHQVQCIQVYPRLVSLFSPELAAEKQLREHEQLVRGVVGAKKVQDEGVIARHENILLVHDVSGLVRLRDVRLLHALHCEHLPHEVARKAFSRVETGIRVWT